MIEAEGMLSDGTQRWVNVSFKETGHPLYKNDFAELVLHVGKEQPDGSMQWHVVRRENLSTWVMPRGPDEEAGVVGRRYVGTSM